MTAQPKVMYTICITFILFMTIERILAIIGLLLISYAIFVKNEKRQDWLFVIGGILLFYHSYTLNDPIFMTLQVVFVLASLYEIFTLKKTK